MLIPSIKDVSGNSNPKVTLEAQLGLIGGTMGLLTGFSILSGVEIIYFILRFFERDPIIAHTVHVIIP